jgi:hypothetical protein
VSQRFSVNYTEVYMRRRDPHCLVVADDQPSDKPQFTIGSACRSIRFATRRSHG